MRHSTSVACGGIASWRLGEPGGGGVLDVGHVPSVVVHGRVELVVLVSLVLGNKLVQVVVMAAVVVYVFWL